MRCHTIQQNFTSVSDECIASISGVKEVAKQVTSKKQTTSSRTSSANSKLCFTHCMMRNNTQKHSHLKSPFLLHSYSNKNFSLFCILDLLTEVHLTGMCLLTKKRIFHFGTYIPIQFSLNCVPTKYMHQNGKDLDI